MRIIAGQYRNRALRTVTAPGMRPATSKVREALFSALEARGLEWPGALVLDLFAGSGSLGLEALSRGAAYAEFVDKHGPASKAIQGSCKDLGIPPAKAFVRAQDVLAYLQKPHPRREGFDCIFIDPPYHQDLLDGALAAVLEKQWSTPHGMVVAELETKLALPDQHGLEAIFDRTYGQTRIVIWHHATP